MADEPNKNIPDDEIDFNMLGLKFIRIVIYPIRLLFENLKTTAVFILAGVLLSLILKYSLEKTYKGGFIIRPNEKNERTHLRMLEDIQRLLKLKDYKSISDQLKISEADAESIKEIEVVNYSFTKNKSDSSNTTFIELELSEFEQLLPIQNKILAYLEGNPYFNKIKEYQKLNISLKSGLIDKDIQLLDSLKKLQLNSYNKLKITEQNNVFLKDLINPTSTYTLSLERLNQKAGLIGQTMFLDNFQLVKGVVVSEKHSWPPRILIMCLVIVPVFMIACILYLHRKSKQVRRQPD